MEGDELVEARVVKFFTVLTILFGLLFFAQSSNELLKHTVLTQEAEQSLAGEADCRADELIEEGLSVRECELMRVQLEIYYVSIPSWFRSAQMVLQSIAVSGAIASIGLSLAISQITPRRVSSLSLVLVTLLLIDIAGLLISLQTGPLMRAQYLWPSLLWIFIHLSLAVGSLFIYEQKPSEGVREAADF